jgi:hypothetical protein
VAEVGRMFQAEKEFAKCELQRVKVEIWSPLKIPLELSDKVLWKPGG